MLSAGDKLGPYTIVSAIGAGGMGEVYRATDARLQRIVAIKVLLDSTHKRDDMRQRFQREARAISRLNHPNICILHDVGEQDGLDYLVMEYVEGETMETRLRRGPFTVAATLNLGTQIASALDRAHRAGIVHRDLKPSNVMLTKNGAKLLDFGLAKLQTVVSNDETTLVSLTGEQTLAGTLAYMAPEQVECREVDARTDIFALGAMLFEMLTGRTAFTGTSRAGLIAAIISSDPPSLESLGITVPPVLSLIIKTCLAKDPDDRWQSARDLPRK